MTDPQKNISSDTIVECRAPSRLHFGMFSFGCGATRAYGGLGVMVQRPGLSLRAQKQRNLVTCGPLADRAKSTARRFLDSLTTSFGCRIEILAAPQDHMGLGTGTQLALAVSSALNELAGNPYRDSLQLARIVGRGNRSAIGTHGFRRGGLLIDGGKLPEEALGVLETRISFPGAWRFVLIHTGQSGLHGEAEQQAFRQLPPVPREVTRRLRDLAGGTILPAAKTQDFSTFSESLYEFGVLAGNCFAAQQGGPFASQQIAALAEEIRAMGVACVGQSSWGPTMFALLESQQAAEGFLAELKRHPLAGDSSFTITAASNEGANIVQRKSVLSDEQGEVKRSAYSSCSDEA